MNTLEKIKIIKEVAEELINEEDLIKLLENVKNPVAYDGMEPSGQIHIAQGLLRAININKMTSCGIKFKILLADYFAMLNNMAPATLAASLPIGSPRPCYPAKTRSRYSLTHAYELNR